MLAHDLSRCLPDYSGGSIVNLMSTLAQHFGVASDYPGLRLFPAKRLEGSQRVALIVIDGMGAELLEQYARSSALRQHQVATMTSVFPPTTASAISSFMTGTAPQQHGLTGWFMHFRELGAVTAVLPFMTRYNRAGIDRSGVAFESLINAAAFATALGVPSAALLPDDLKDSAFSRGLSGTEQRQGYRDLNGFVTALEQFCHGKNRYLYAYWPYLDSLAHRYGPSATQVKSHLQELDAALAPLIASAQATDTLLIITADHGFIDSGPAECIHLSSHPELGAMLSQPLCGEPRSAYAYVRHSCADAFEDYIASEFKAFATAYPSEQLIEAGWFGLGRPHPELAARLGDYVLVMKQRYTLRDTVLGETHFDLLGMHGGITRAEQLVPLIVSAA